MKITICGSQTNAKKIQEVVNDLEKAGHKIFSHKLMRKAAAGDEETLRRIKDEHYKLKMENNTFKWYYDAIKNSDLVLVCNFEKNGIPGYIGGSALMEIGYAHVLDKKIFFLYQIPEISYKEELVAARPIILNGDLNKIK